MESVAVAPAVLAAPEVPQRHGAEAAAANRQEPLVPETNDAPSLLVHLPLEKYESLLAHVSKKKKEHDTLRLGLLRERDERTRAQAAIAEATRALEEKERELRAYVEEVDRLSHTSAALTRKVGLLQEELAAVRAESEGGAGGGGSVLGSLLSSANWEARELEKLGQRLATATRELEAKITENESLHMQLFDARQAAERAAGDRARERAVLEGRLADAAELAAAKERAHAVLAGRCDALARRVDELRSRAAAVTAQAQLAQGQLATTNATLAARLAAMQAHAAAVAPLDTCAVQLYVDLDCRSVRNSDSTDASFTAPSGKERAFESLVAIASKATDAAEAGRSASSALSHWAAAVDERSTARLALPVASLGHASATSVCVDPPDGELGVPAAFGIESEANAVPSHAPSEAAAIGQGQEPASEGEASTFSAIRRALAERLALEQRAQAKSEREYTATSSGRGSDAATPGLEQPRFERPLRSRLLSPARRDRDRPASHATAIAGADAGADAGAAASRSIANKRSSATVIGSADADAATPADVAGAVERLGRQARLLRHDSDLIKGVIELKNSVAVATRLFHVAASAAASAADGASSQARVASQSAPRAVMWSVEAAIKMRTPSGSIEELPASATEPVDAGSGHADLLRGIPSWATSILGSAAPAVSAACLLWIAASAQQVCTAELQCLEDAVATADSALATAQAAARLSVAPITSGAANDASGAIGGNVEPDDELEARFQRSQYADRLKELVAVGHEACAAQRQAIQGWEGFARRIKQACGEQGATVDSPADAHADAPIDTPLRAWIDDCVQSMRSASIATAASEDERAMPADPVERSMSAAMAAADARLAEKEGEELRDASDITRSRAASASAAFATSAPTALHGWPAASAPASDVDSFLSLALLGLTRALNLHLLLPDCFAAAFLAAAPAQRTFADANFGSLAKCVAAAGATGLLAAASAWRDSAAKCERFYAAASALSVHVAAPMSAAAESVTSVVRSDAPLDLRSFAGESDAAGVAGMAGKPLSEGSPSAVAPDFELRTVTNSNLADAPVAGHRHSAFAAVEAAHESAVRCGRAAVVVVLHGFFASAAAVLSVGMQAYLERAAGAQTPHDKAGRAAQRSTLSLRYVPVHAASLSGATDGSAASVAAGSLSETTVTHTTSDVEKGNSLSTGAASTTAADWVASLMQQPSASSTAPAATAVAVTPTAGSQTAQPTLFASPPRRIGPGGASGALTPLSGLSGVRAFQAHSGRPHGHGAPSPFGSPGAAGLLSPSHGPARWIGATHATAADIPGADRQAPLVAAAAYLQPAGDSRTLAGVLAGQSHSRAAAALAKLNACALPPKVPHSVALSATSALASASAAAEDAGRHLSAAEATIQELRSALALAEAEAGAAREQAEQARQRAIADATSSAQRLAEARAEADRYRQAAGLRATQVESLQADLASAQKALADVRQEANIACQARDESIAAHAETTLALAAEKEALVALQEQLDRAIADSSASEAALTAQLAEAAAAGSLLETAAAQERQVAASLVQELEAVRSASALELEAVRSASAQELEAVRSASAQELEAVRSASAQELEALRSASAAAAAAATEQQAALQDQLSRTQMRLDATAKQLAHAQSDAAAELIARADAAEADKTALAARVDAAEANKAALTARADAAEADKAALVAQLDAAAADKAALTARVAAAEAEKAALDARVEASEADKTALAKQLAAVQAELHRLREESTWQKPKADELVSAADGGKAQSSRATPATPTVIAHADILSQAAAAAAAESLDASALTSLQQQLEEERERVRSLQARVEDSAATEAGISTQLRAAQAALQLQTRLKEEALVQARRLRELLEDRDRRSAAAGSGSSGGLAAGSYGSYDLDGSGMGLGFGASRRMEPEDEASTHSAVTGEGVLSSLSLASAISAAAAALSGSATRSGSTSRGDVSFEGTDAHARDAGTDADEDEDAASLTARQAGLQREVSLRVTAAEEAVRTQLTAAHEASLAALRERHAGEIADLEAHVAELQLQARRQQAQADAEASEALSSAREEASALRVELSAVQGELAARVRELDEAIARRDAALRELAEAQRNHEELVSLMSDSYQGQIRALSDHAAATEAELRRVRGGSGR